jgi:hypothetical protein
MADLLKHGRYRYCNKDHCRWWSKCGLALTEAIRSKAATDGLDIPLKENCVYDLVSFEAPKEENDE